ncbi:hypothetical protein BFP70_02165 [Thioclava sp. SK-1]|uniref:hypothetical protein n=1 Tax=Thioclava sp. SK-1 TaxID=1889770 RepID=UPI0008246026|nr:hypothetical protein [Thioclava sp. SK-1]OCX67002.1 hypothetical protein BFP70_02165 [Thioclava sp. SK-1]
MLKYKEEIEHAALELAERNGMLKRLPIEELLSRHRYMEELCERLSGEQQALKTAFHQVNGHIDTRVGADESEMSEPVSLPTELAADLEELETEIRIYQYQMKVLQEVIQETAPSDLSESMLKLKFLSKLMSDGIEIDPEAFAQLIEDCAEITNLPDPAPATLSLVRAH